MQTNGLKLWVGTLATMMATVVACSTTKGTTRSSVGGSQEFAAPIHQPQGANEKVTEFDLNHDGKPDVWTYTVKAKTADGKEYDKLVRKELDVNFDGKVDIARYYGDDEQLEKEALDFDFDGKIDQWNYYQKGVLVRKERDTKGVGRPDLWIFYEKGHIVRKERDVKGFGKVDYWEYWENDHVDRVGEDLDGDGRIDRWSKAPSAGG